MLSLRSVLPLFLLSLAASPLSACAPTRPPARPGSLAYSQEARRLYQRGLDAFYDRAWEEATARFTELKERYSQSPYARLAELRLADISFEKDAFPEAIAAYKDFSKSHRGDPSVVYARFRICQALVKQINDTILLPPQEERDQGPVREAYVALKQFKHTFPHTKWDRQVDFMLLDVSGRLARHEAYVARFYLRMGRFTATVARLQTLLREYPHSGLEPEALLLLGETYLKMHEKEKARVVFRRAVRMYPASPFTKLANTYLANIESSQANDGNEEHD